MKKLKKKKSKQEIKKEEKKIKDNLDEVLKNYTMLRMLVITSDYCKVDYSVIDEVKLHTTSLNDAMISKFNDLIHRFAKLVDRQARVDENLEFYKLLTNVRLKNSFSIRSRYEKT